MGPIPKIIHEYIMVVGDYFTKWKEAYALKDHTTQTVADVLIKFSSVDLGFPCKFILIKADNLIQILFQRYANSCEWTSPERHPTTPNWMVWLKGVTVQCRKCLQY